MVPRSGRLAPSLPAHQVEVWLLAELPPAGQQRGTGRRDLIGAWHRPNSGVSADRSCRPLQRGDRSMVTLGTDSHKESHTVVAVDGNGRKRVRATPDGHLEALSWARQWPERRWALEDCRQLSRRLERELLGAGESVLRVAPRLMAAAREGVRERGKSDPIDAQAVALVALRESNLPVARLEGVSRELRLLVDHRENLVAERTRAQSRLRWLLHELEPGRQVPSRGLDRLKVLNEFESLLPRLQGCVAELAGELLQNIRQLSIRINRLEQRIALMVTPLAPTLLGLHGCGALTAAKLIGETAGIQRFHSPAAFAMHNGSAPIPVWSGRPERHRLNRGGNRQLNAALHRIAITQP